MAEPEGKARGSGIIIRKTRDSDAAALSEIYRPYVEETVISFELTPPDSSEMARRISATKAAGYPHLVAEEGSGVTGYAYAGRYRGRPAYDRTVETTVYIRQDCQGRGAGRALMAALETRLREQGFHMMIAGYSGNDRPASVGFHEALGFIHAGEIPEAGFKFGRWHAQGFLWKRL